MKRKVIIHAGMHKTGTSYIQNAIYDNREKLRPLGFYYPETGLVKSNPQVGFRHFPLKVSLTEERESALSLRLLKEEIEASGCDRIVISYEGFLNADLPAETLLNGFAEYDLRVIAYVRSPVDYIESKYREWVRRVNYSGEMSDFLRSQRRFLNYGRLFRPWMDALGERLVVKSFENSGKGIDLFNDFVRTCGYDGPIPELAKVTEENFRATNDYILSKLYANKLRLAGRTVSSTLIEGNEYFYGSNGGRLLSDEELAHVQAEFEPGYREILSHIGEDPDIERSSYKKKPMDTAFHDPEVRKAVLGHVETLIERHRGEAERKLARSEAKRMKQVEKARRLAEEREKSAALSREPLPASRKPEPQWNPVRWWRKAIGRV